LVERAFSKVPDDQKQIMSVAAFTRGMLDQDIARLVCAQSPSTIAKALKIAANTLVASSKTSYSKLKKFRPQATKYPFYATTT